MFDFLARSHCTNHKVIHLVSIEMRPASPVTPVFLLRYEVPEKFVRSPRIFSFTTCWITVCCQFSLLFEVSTWIGRDLFLLRFHFHGATEVVLQTVVWSGGSWVEPLLEDLVFDSKYADDIALLNDNAQATQPGDRSMCFEPSTGKLPPQ